MTFSTNRELREQVWRGWTNRGDNDNANNNEGVIEVILALRLNAPICSAIIILRLSDREHHGRNPENAYSLLSEVWEGATAKAAQEEEEIRAIMAAEGASIISNIGTAALCRRRAPHPMLLMKMP